MVRDLSFAVRLLILALTLAFIMSSAAKATEDPAEVEAVIASTKEVQPDSTKLCQAGQPGILNAASMQARALAMEGKIRGNSQAVAAEAAAKIGKDCFGGG